MSVDANGRALAVGDVVQIDPSTTEGGGFFGGCFMQVTELKIFGAQGFVCIPGSRGEPPGWAFCRPRSAEMVLVGRAEWQPARNEAAR